VIVPNGKREQKVRSWIFSPLLYQLSYPANRSAAGPTACAGKMLQRRGARAIPPLSTPETHFKPAQRTGASPEWGKVAELQSLNHPLSDGMTGSFPIRTRCPKAGSAI
jgi:hypothetical protein